MDVATITALTTSLGVLIGILCKTGVDAYLRVRTEKRTEKREEEATEHGRMQYYIGRQDARIEKLETDLAKVHHEHNDCEKRFTAVTTEMKMRFEQMNNRMGAMEADSTTAKTDSKTKLSPEHIEAAKRIAEHQAKYHSEEKK